MGRRRAPLPPPFEHGAFRFSDAVAAGVGAKRLRGSLLDHPFHGIHQRAPAVELSARCRALLLRLPTDAVFCGPTAARLQGIPLPWRVESDQRLHVAVPPPRRALRVRGVAGRRGSHEPSMIRQWLGLPVTAPAHTWRDLASELTLADLVAAGDFLLHGDRPVASLDEVRAAAARPGRGVRNARLALPLLDGRAESPRESRLRLLLVEAGVEGFELQHPVVIAGWRQPARIDIAFPRQRLGLEYQGEYHHDPDQWRRDMTRLSRLRSLGWNMIELSKDDLRDPVELAHRIRRLLALSR